MYPKMGHLYDPPAARRSTQDDDDNNTPAFMSGGAEGLPPQSAVGTARTSLESGARFGLGVSPFSDPGNPFRDSNEYTQAYIEASGSSPRSSVEVPAALRIVDSNSQYDSQYRLTSQWSATESDNSRPSQESHEYVSTCPSLSPFVGTLHRSHARARSHGSTGSTGSRSQCMSNTTPSAPSIVAPNCRTQSRHGPLSCYNQPSPRESGITNPFEHDTDLPLQTDAITESQDSVLIYAPSPTYRVPSRTPWATLPNDGRLPTKPPFIKFHSNNPYRPQRQPTSAPAPTIAVRAYSPEHHRRRHHHHHHHQQQLDHMKLLVLITKLHCPTNPATFHGWL